MPWTWRREEFELPHHSDLPAYFGELLQAAVEDGTVSEAMIDQKAERVLRLIASSAGAENGHRESELDTERHRTLARRIAIEGSILLKKMKYCRK